MAARRQHPKPAAAPQPAAVAVPPSPVAEARGNDVAVTAAHLPIVVDPYLCDNPCGNNVEVTFQPIPSDQVLDEMQRVPTPPELKYHACANVAAALRDWTRQDWINATTRLIGPNRRRYMRGEWDILKSHMADALRSNEQAEREVWDANNKTREEHGLEALSFKGVELFVPLEACDNFDAERGCLGHEKL